MQGSTPRVAVISDVHGNIDALDAVMEDIRNHGVEKVVCLGDMVGYGAAPRECVKAVRKFCECTVLGNHEAMTIFEDILLLEQMPIRITKPIELARKELSRGDIDWIRQLPLVAQIDAFTAVHSSLFSPAEFPYVFRTEEARMHFAAQQGHLAFHGHSHVPVIWEEKGPEIRAHFPRIPEVRLAPNRRYFINVGSVGQPRDGDPRACYVIYDHDKMDVLFRRVPYDIEAAKKRIVAANLSPKNGDRLFRGE